MMAHLIFSFTLIALLGITGIISEETSQKQRNISTLLSATKVDSPNETLDRDVKNADLPSGDNKTRVKRQYGYNPYGYRPYRPYYPVPVPIPIVVGGIGIYGGGYGRGFGGRGFGGRGYGGGRGFGGFGGRGVGGFGGRGGFGGFGGRGGRG